MTTNVKPDSLRVFEDDGSAHLAVVKRLLTAGEPLDRIARKTGLSMSQVRRLVEQLRLGRSTG